MPGELPGQKVLVLMRFVVIVRVLIGRRGAVMDVRSGAMLTVLSAALTGTFGLAQSTTPTFEVASVKLQPARVEPTGPPVVGASPQTRTTFRRSNATLVSLVQFAYELRAFQVIGGPDWARKDLFEIMAKPSGDTPAERQMLRALLEDRFKLRVRREQREVTSYELVVARKDGQLGSGLKRCVDPSVPRPQTAIRIPPGAYGSGTHAWCDTLQPIVATAGAILNAIVVDKTGLEGKWTYSFFVEDPTPPRSALVRELAEKENLPTLPVALQEELGLKLKEVKGPIDVIVIDSVDHPTEN
jgi:uncharacterized protein (TIGR03435 family)